MLAKHSGKENKKEKGELKSIKKYISTINFNSKIHTGFKALYPAADTKDSHRTEK